MMKISDTYKEMNSRLHADNANFGAKGYKVAPMVTHLYLLKYNPTSVIDYGCGKGTLGPAIFDILGREKMPTWINYDPCVAHFKNRPDGVFDGLVCTDVIEHIEPDHLNEVLDDILKYAKTHFLRISLVASNKFLPDGRNAHLIIESSSWWLKKLEERGFHVLKVLETEANSERPEVVNLTVITTRKQ